MVRPAPAELCCCPIPAACSLISYQMIIQLIRPVHISTQADPSRMKPTDWAFVVVLARTRSAAVNGLTKRRPGWATPPAATAGYGWQRAIRQQLARELPLVIISEIWSSRLAMTFPICSSSQRATASTGVTSPRQSVDIHLPPLLAAQWPHCPVS